MPKYDRITPEGTRDILSLECETQNKITGKLRRIFGKDGYREVRTPGFEFYDVFAAHADYYPQESMYKLADGRGRLMTVRPDSTIPIARMTATKLKGAELPLRVYYAQRVYRQQEELRGRSGEIMQMGVELIGSSSFESDMEVLELAARSLTAALPGNFRIEIGHVGLYKKLMADLPATGGEKEAIRRCIASKNYAGLNDVLDGLRPTGRAAKSAKGARAIETAEMIRRLPRLFGGTEALREAAELMNGYSKELAQQLDYMKKLFSALKRKKIAENFMIDFGLVNQADYYSSLVFRGYTEDAGSPVLSGGRYDDLFADFGEDLPATGFGLNIDMLTASVLKASARKGRKPGAAGAAGASGVKGIAGGVVSAAARAAAALVGVADDGRAAPGEKNAAKGKRASLRIALTKGRLEDDFVALMERAGYNVSEIRDKGRKLLLSVPGTNIEIFLAKAPDVITYVEHGVCDIGVVGKDTILEHGGVYYEIMDLGIGKCRFALAAPEGTDPLSGLGTKVIATKYPAFTGRYFENRGMDVDIIRIEGSVEIAPLLALADGIVDIVETGTTLKENGLSVAEVIREISARLIVNVSSMKLKKAAVDAFAGRLGEVIS
jgi:ATP phosphoribosyltransferase regulatory subunit